jgi:NAD(P)-dependent dehydrogenase (short-subunit alcohol dehydrogenase family)
MKIAIITGGSRGLGKNTAEHLAAKGVGVIFTYHSKEVEAAQLVRQIEEKGGKAHAIQLDVGNSKNFPAFVESVKNVLKTKWNSDKFDYLVNNAGHGSNALLTETTEEQFDLLFNVHLKGTFFITQKLLPIMNDGGRIINTSTGLARFALPGYSAYASMKGAIEVLTRYMAKELGPRGITVNTIAPGAIETDFGGGHVRDNKDLNNFIASQSALGRAGVPDDIGGAISSLLTEDNRWITAQRIEVSGGMFI